jgi:ParB-like chromosome segregation protein Spo0J
MSSRLVLSPPISSHHARPDGYHPACLLFPKLTGPALDELAADIKDQGLIEPIVLLDGQVLDGKNRLAACQIAGVNPRFVKWDGLGSPIEWVISTNLIRRHLTPSQRAAIAHDLLPLLEAEAKQRQRGSRGRGKKVAKEFATFSDNGKASEVAARIARSNPRYVETIKRLAQEAPDLVPKIRSGQLSVPIASRLSRLKPPERTKILDRTQGEEINSRRLQELTRTVLNESRHQSAKQFARTTKARRDQGIIIGEMGLLWDRLDDDSVDLFLTDPPFDEIEGYERLAQLAASKLKPGRLCLAYTGHLRLPEVLSVMGRHLTYWWTFTVVYGGQPVPIHSRHIQNRSRLIVAFACPPVRPAARSLADVIEGGGREKDHHDWGQGEAEARYLLTWLTEPGALVVDGYCGGGTIPAACKGLGREWMATERDKETAMVARRRLCQ